MKEPAGTWEDAAQDAMDRIFGSGLAFIGHNPLQRVGRIESFLDRQIADPQRSDLLPFVGLMAYIMSRSSRSEIVKLLAQKQHSYGHGNINKFGLQGILVRLSDKVCRLKNLYERGEDPQFSETLDDTWTDIVGYCVIALMLDAGTFDLPLAADLVCRQDADDLATYNVCNEQMPDSQPNPWIDSFAHGNELYVDRKLVIDAIAGDGDVYHFVDGTWVTDYDNDFNGSEPF